jgi:hypothetical protein
MKHVNVKFGLVCFGLLWFALLWFAFLSYSINRKGRLEKKKNCL